MVGGRAAVRALSPERRKYYRDMAIRLHDAGTTAGAAEKYMRRNKNGFVYVISHPSWGGYVKIGRACDPHQRLNSFQTGCPLRQYELHLGIYFHDCHYAEEELHARLEDSRVGGEWFRIPIADAVAEVRLLRETL